jgi:dynein heavy chain, axonemal
MDGLAAERISWKKRSEDLMEASKTILGDTIMASGIIAYLGAFPKDYREEVIDKWMEMIQAAEIVINKEFSLRNTCCDDLTIGNWVDKFSLPNDQISIQNAIILHESQRYPLIIDPQV